MNTGRQNDNAHVRQQLAEQIKRRREQLKLTQAQLAQRARLGTLQVVSSIERGERDIKASELAAIAKVLHCDLTDLFAEETDSTPIVAWRERPEANAEDLAAHFRRLCENYHLAEIWAHEERDCDLPSVRLPRGTPTFTWARKIADQIRNELGLGNLPATSLYETLEERCGVKIFFFPNLLGSAACTWGDFGAAIVLNASEVPWRRNFSLAHELFHLVTWDRLSPEHTDTNGWWSDLIEKWANAFASSLLLPESPLRDVLNAHRDAAGITWRGFVEVAREFKVSIDALVWRLVSLSILTENQAHELLDNPAFRMIDRETFSLTPDPKMLPERFLRLLETAYLQNKVSAGRIAEMTDKTLADVHHWLSKLEENEVGARKLVRLA